MYILISANAATFIYKGTAFGWSVGFGDKLGIITILLLFLPNLIIAMFTTMGRTKWRKLMINHPSILLLPTFTFFSFQRINPGYCGSEKPDNKIIFSKKMTMLNIIVNLICFGILFAPVRMWQYNEEWYKILYCYPWYCLRNHLLAIPLPVFVVAVLLSMIFMFMEDFICGCFLDVACCNVRDQARIYDPEQEDNMEEVAVVMEQIKTKEQDKAQSTSSSAESSLSTVLNDDLSQRSKQLLQFKIKEYKQSQGSIMYFLAFYQDNRYAPKSLQHCTIISI